jgi:hypothetical protein
MLKSRSRKLSPDPELSYALHTTPGIPEQFGPEVHLVALGMETDVLGQQLDEITVEQRAAVTFSREDFVSIITQSAWPE